MAGNFKAIQARLFEPKPRSHRTGFPATLKRVASLMLSAFLFKPPRACMTTTSTKVAIRETSARFYTDTIWRLVPHVVVPTRPCGAKIGRTCAELPSNARGVTATRWYAGSSSQNCACAARDVARYSASAYTLSAAGTLACASPQPCL